MIKLNRNPIDPALQGEIDERIALLQAHLAAGTLIPEALKTSYRAPPVKAHLVSEAHGKCMYCESKITHVYFGDVEHIRPKEVFPGERLTMENLGLACAVCNNNKGNFWNALHPLLDPYVDDPDAELIALGFIIARRPGRDRARITIERLELNRTALLERRKERVELIQPLADQYAVAPEGALKELLRAELSRQARDDAEYAFIIRSFFSATGIEPA